MTADYSQIEMRIMAHLSQDEALIEAFRSGADFHAVTASVGLRRCRWSEVGPEQRRRVKAMNYGLAYGLSAFGLSQQLGITPGRGEGADGGVLRPLRRGARLPAVDRRRRPGMDGYTETVLGRRRYLPDLTSDNRQRREMAERMALNAPIQGSAADIIKVAMLRVDTALRRRPACARGCCCRSTTSSSSTSPRASAKPLEALVREQMGGAYPLDVPLEVSVGVGRDWDAADH